MSEDSTKIIIHNWTELLDINEITCLANLLKEKNVFTQKDITSIFSLGDYSHKRRMFLFHLLEQKESVFEIVSNWLFSQGYQELANKLTSSKSGCIRFRIPNEEEENELSNSMELNPLPINNDQTSLKVKVSLASEFLDSKEHNPNLLFYSSRSKRRGRVLIINNYEFPGTAHPVRNGAYVDQENLESLFSQMGGWVIEINNNKTADEMRFVLEEFVSEKKHKSCDICFVFILSHGSEKLYETIVYGRDGNYMTTNDIENYFINENCSLFRGKPKVFIYQVCRGAEIDLSRTYTDTEFDGKLKTVEPNVNKSVKKTYRPEDDMLIGTYTEFEGKFLDGEIKENVTMTNNPQFYRRIDDMLIGHATVPGTKAHRDPFRGTWYIELICKNFMTLAKEESVDNLLIKVDEGLRKRMSEMHTVQTSQTSLIGFKKLYLNPGIYEENGELKRFL